MATVFKFKLRSGGRHPHTTMRQLILDAIMRLRVKKGSTQYEIKRSIERFYRCKLGKKFVGQLNRALERMVEEAQLHLHNQRFTIVPTFVMSFGPRMRDKRPHCFCLTNNKSYTGRSLSRSLSTGRRSRSRSRSGSRPRSRSRGRSNSRGPRKRGRSRSRSRRSRRRSLRRKGTKCRRGMKGRSKSRSKKRRRRCR